MRVKVRTLLVVAHRWAGLTIAGFVLIAALTGSALAFQQELTWMCAPPLGAPPPPSPGAKPLSGPELAMRVAATGPATPFVPLTVDGRHALAMFVSTAPGRPALDYNQVVVDPYTGVVKAQLKYGALRVFPRDLLSLVFGLHYGFVIGPWAQFAFGVAALIWTLDGFVGLALTLPPAWWRRTGERAAARDGAAGGAVRPHARGYRLHYDLHQAGGLWLWSVLLVFASSAVLMTLPQVGAPVTHLLGGEGSYAPPPLAAPRLHSRLTPVEAAAQGERLLAREARRDGFTVLAGDRLDYREDAGAWRYAARTSWDVTLTGGETEAWFSDTDGRLLHLQRPKSMPKVWWRALALGVAESCVLTAGGAHAQTAALRPLGEARSTRLQTSTQHCATAR